MQPLSTSSIYGLTMKSNTNPPLEIRAISPAETLPLRRALLRPELPLSESVYPGDDAATTKHWGAFADDVLVAVASLYPESLPASSPQSSAFGRAWRLRGMAVDADYQRQGCGAQLIHRCLQSVAEDGGEMLWCNARASAVGFYRRAGFEISGDEFIIPGVGPHFVMLRSAAAQKAAILNFS